MSEIHVALAPFLSTCPSVTTIGVRACIDDYPLEHQRLLRDAKCVLFPTLRFLSVFQAIGKATFPSAASYRYPRSRVLQVLLFQHIKLPHPRSRIYFGTRQKKRIVEDFSFPFLVMGTRPTADPVHFVSRPQMLEHVLPAYNPVIVQEFIHWQDRVRLIFVRFNFIGAFRESLAGTGHRAFEPIPLEHPVLELPLEITSRILPLIQLDDTMVEWGLEPDGWRLLAFTRPPIRWKTLTGTMNRHSYICRAIQSRAI